ncbi:MAG: mandelate racemase/muconate lactonizing enzyme family protein [Anaerolineae bacterium]|nr:mandelate racemase/muconate lactonizing enzyme family protein [Anaerolineae bacterium]
MTIEHIEAIPVRIKRDAAYLGTLPPGADPDSYFVRPPYRSLYSASFETVFVKITTSEGAVGWGEALAPVAPEVVATIINQLLAPVLRGRDPHAGDYLWSLMYNLMRERGYHGGFMLDAISACDIALWDVRGKLLGQPVYKLLGGPYREQVPCYVSGLPRSDHAGRIELAQEWLAKDFHTFKLHVGHGVQADTEIMRALRDALDVSTMLMLDGHWVYSLDEAVQLGHHLEALDVALFEAPLNPEDIDAHVKLAEAIAVPVAIGETERTRFQFKPWLTRRGADVLQPDAGRVGISELIKIATMAEAFNIPIAPHLSVGLGPCIAASIHVSAAISNFWLLEYQPPVFELANSLLKSPLVCQAGHYHLPEGPGLGIEIDEQRLKDLQR